MGCCHCYRRRRNSCNYVFRGHDSGGDERFLFLEKELVKDDQALGEHVVVPGVARAEENLCGVEAVHVPFPQPVEAVNLLNLAVGERAVVDLDPGNGSLQKSLSGCLVLGSRSFSA
ncbi:hypothetical protein V8G54_033939 [Vigna mungo]|uniref:Uncharacterized protein n=1 Tax=Vigna mungo TaxID=3915 RepID=A0AAQ3MPV9_VIGMU